jgi:hypothetical protein
MNMSVEFHPNEPKHPTFGQLPIKGYFATCDGVNCTQDVPSRRQAKDCPLRFWRKTTVHHAEDLETGDSAAFEDYCRVEPLVNGTITTKIRV